MRLLKIEWDVEKKHGKNNIITKDEMANEEAIKKVAQWYVVG